MVPILLYSNYFCIFEINSKILSLVAKKYSSELGILSLVYSYLCPKYRCRIMKKNLPVFLFVVMMCRSFSLSAQQVSMSEWMSHVSDTVSISSMSIPGTHDAATGEGMLSLPGFGVTQTLGLKEQWRCGVRAFDLRPAVKDTLLYIYHGKLRTKVSFADALDILCAKLRRYPSEFAVVLLREESDSENEKERASWPSLVGRAIQEIGDRATVFSPDMKVADARGKILFLTRSAYKGTEKGALITGWNHSKDGSINARIISYGNGKEARLQVQDYYAPTDARKRAVKQDAVKRYLALAARAPMGVWTMNFLSGYYSTWLGFTSLATTSGYKRNAAWLHPVVLESCKNDGRPMGIVFMDYAGVDKVGGGLWHWKHFGVYGNELVKTIIERNFCQAE